MSLGAWGVLEAKALSGDLGERFDREVTSLGAELERRRLMGRLETLAAVATVVVLRCCTASPPGVRRLAVA